MVLNSVTGQIGEPVSLLKACGDNKYSDFHIKYTPNQFAIPYTSQFKQRYFRQPRADASPEVQAQESEDVAAILFPSNFNRSEDLAERVVGQPDEKFKNKKQVLFAGVADGK